MKKLLSAILAVVMMAAIACSLVSCGASDWEKIKKEGEFVCGITLYEPMNYCTTPNDMSTLTGFDTELAQLVAKELGVKVKFQVIDWKNKYIELNGGTIDCIWNGFTSNSKDDDGVDRKDKVDFTYAYLDNAQCVVVKSDRLASITSASSLQGLVGTAEADSAGASFAKTVTSKTLIEKGSQMDTFTEVMTGAAQFAVVDVLLAEKIVGQGDYAGLAIASNVSIDKEVYSIGCRKNSDFDEKINEALVKLLNEGKIEALAEKYDVHVTDELLSKKTAK